MISCRQVYGLKRTLFLPEHEDFRESVRGFLNKEAVPHRDEWEADGKLDRVEIVYNAYISPLTQRVARETLLPISRATIAGEQGAGAVDGSTQAPATPSAGESPHGPRALVSYEPEPEEILKRLVPDYVEVSIYRALVESTAGFFGAQMTAMRSASDNAGELITDLTLQMNRARQAEITQEIMEVVAGSEGIS